MSAPAEPLTQDRLTFFVPAKLVNAKNAREHWGARHRRAQVQREAVAMAVFQALHADPRMRWTIAADPSQPKHVTIVAHVFNRFDSHDGLRAACAHLVDGLGDARLIGMSEARLEAGKLVRGGHVQDADRHGHVFDYTQVIDRTRRGATITVQLRASVATAGEKRQPIQAGEGQESLAPAPPGRPGVTLPPGAAPLSRARGVERA
jgi:hypothetical protein